MSASGIRSFLLRQSRIIVLLVLLIFFSLTTETFWSPTSWTNLLNIVLDQFPVLLLLAAGMTLVIIMRGIDLSIGAAVAFSSALAALTMKATQNIWLGIVASLLVGILIGIANGTLIAVVRMPPYIATISMKWIITGLCYVVLNGSSVYDFPPQFKAMMQSTKYNYLIIAIVVVAALAFVMSKTVFGRQVYATGINSEAAKLSGIKTNRITILVFAIVGLLASCTGIIYMSFLGGVDANLGGNFPIRAIAASLIGGNAFGGGRGKVTNAIVGALIMLVLTNGLLHLGVAAEWQQFVLGAVIVLSVVIESLNFHKKQRKVKVAERF